MEESKAKFQVSGEGIVEQTIDLLKNTPSNIARLEDVIDHCKGRQKYLAQTKSPSDGEDVRWYFCKVPLAENELAALVPKTQTVGKGEYFRFGMRDSLALEASFLEREEELLSIWWKEYGECSEGPSGTRGATSASVDLQLKSGSSESDQSTQLSVEEEERVGVPVKGGLYEVDLAKRHCFPVYWNGENRRVLRGHWFARKASLDWLPLREDVAEQLEFAYRCQVWHRRTFQQSGLFAARVDIGGFMPGLHALFTGEDDTWEAWLNIDASGFSGVIHLSGNGIQLRRGFSSSGASKLTQDELRQQKEEEMDDYCSQVPVGHLVFMVHGIGQRLEKANLVDDVGNFRQITASLAERHLTSYQRDTQRILFIPCQWRKGLKLGGESAVDDITLKGVRGLRVMLGATAHDILYYMSPIYCQEIINSVSNQLNRLYKKFLKRNPGYDGKVSIYAHSLGSVLSYDILCHQEDLSSPFPMDFVHKEEAKEEEHSPDKSDERLQSRPVADSDSISSTTTIEDLSPMFQEESDRDQLDSPMSEQIQESNSVPDLSLDDIQQHGATDILSLEADHVDSINRNSDGFCNEDKLQKCTSDNTSDKEKEIKLLREEVDSLKAKIADLESQRPQEQLNVHRSYTHYIKYTKLEFQVDTYFAVGSPLGVFLALRNIRMGIGKGKDYWQDDTIIEQMPACRQMFNIFHPFDPVAYRVEPLVCKEYVNRRPVLIPYHRGGKRLHIGFQEFTEHIASRSHAVVNRINTVTVKVLTACQSSKNDDLDKDTENSSEIEERSYGSVMMERLTGSQEGRIDYMLQDKTFQHQYISVLGAHTNYWRDLDTALFILKHLYRDIPEEPNSPTMSDTGNTSSTRNNGPTKGRFYQKDTDDDELPLTFSDKMVAKEFSRKVRKAMKKTV
ncbi:Phospholipase sgr2 [Ranunculus cassubicifolius]